MRYYKALCSICSNDTIPVFRDFIETNEYVECQECKNKLNVQRLRSGDYMLLKQTESIEEEHKWKQ